MDFRPIINEWLKPIPLFCGRKKELLALENAFRLGIKGIIIHGIGGIGKSMLAHEFVSRSRNLFPGGAAVVDESSSIFLDTMNFLDLNIPFPLLPKKPCVLIFDAKGEIDAPKFQTLLELTKRNPSLNLILTSRENIDSHYLPSNRSKYFESIYLKPFNRQELSEFLHSRLEKVSSKYLELAYEKSGGHPLVLEILVSSLQQGNLNWETFFNLLSNFNQPGLWGLDGRPLVSGSREERQLINDVKLVNTDVIRRLRNDPNELWLLSPRKFEEAIAEILTRLGYTVELTPPSRDGGFDMYAAKKEPLGTFLYLVECKRYLPPNKVGINIIRQLHGVVQSNKATAGIITTTSHFTTGAQEFQEQNKHQIQLKDYLNLQEWLKEIH